MPAGDGTATLAEVVRRLDAEGVRARGLQLREPSLDDVFLALTGHAAEHEGAGGTDPRGGVRAGGYGGPVAATLTAPAPGGGLLWALRDSEAMAGRNLRRRCASPSRSSST